MSDQTILYILAALGWAGVIITQLRRRTTTMHEWFAENAWGLVSGFVATATLLFIGPGDGTDLSSYVARTWAAGIGATSAYLIGGNTPSPSASTRRQVSRAESKANA
jgi:hypothetical protein